MILIDDEWCFIHIPKTSGTNLRYVFPQERCVKYGGNQYWDEFWSNTNSEILSSFTNQIKECNIVKHAPLHFWEENGVVKNHKVFTIVRNPYTRFLSWYHEINRIVNIFNLPFTNVSFEEFTKSKYINLLLNQLPYKSFTNKTNQVDYLIDKSGKIHVDRIYKMETDLDKIELDFNISDIHKHKINFLSYNKNYAEVYNSKTIDWVQENFQKDFDYFNYNIDPFWL